MFFGALELTNQKMGLTTRLFFLIINKILAIRLNKNANFGDTELPITGVKFYSGGLVEFTVSFEVKRHVKWLAPRSVSLNVESRFTRHPIQEM